MARIEGVPKSQAGLTVRLAYRFGPRMMRKLSGREPQRGSGLEPMEIWAHQPKMMMAMGRFNQAIRKGRGVEERLRNLIELKAAQMSAVNTALTSARRSAVTPAFPTMSCWRLRATDPASC